MRPKTGGGNSTFTPACAICPRTVLGKQLPIPPYGMSGLLPPFVGADATTADRSPYMVSIGDLAERFGTTPLRRQLLRNLIAYRQLLATDGYADGYQFIDGSFVEEVEWTQSRPPSDIDVFSFLNAPLKYHSDPAAWGATGLPFWSSEIIDRDKNKQRFSLDTYALLLQETTLPSLIQGVIYWYGLFSHQRDTFVWKGFAAVPLDSNGDQAALAALGSA